jgi:hypothetical protein
MGMRSSPIVRVQKIKKPRKKRTCKRRTCKRHVRR